VLTPDWPGMCLELAELGASTGTGTGTGGWQRWMQKVLYIVLTVTKSDWTGASHASENQHLLSSPGQTTKGFAMLLGVHGSRYWWLC